MLFPLFCLWVLVLVTLNILYNLDVLITICNIAGVYPIVLHEHPRYFFHELFCCALYQNFSPFIENSRSITATVKALINEGMFPSCQYKRELGYMSLEVFNSNITHS